MSNTKITKCVENICKQGCNRVTEIIALLERGEHLNEIDNLEAKEIDILLAELKAIMSVYKSRS